MWVSPRAAETNARAVVNRSHLENCAAHGLHPEENRLATLKDCECADWGGHPCGGKLIPVLWYDPFSEDPKGLIYLCEDHHGEFGNPTEGFFTCGECGKVHIENYTWELYYVEKDGELLCMRCAAKQEIEDEDNWIDLAYDYKHYDPIKGINFEQIRRAKHLFPVECQDYFGLEFIGNTEFSSMSGESISGGGVQGVRDLLYKARNAGYTKAMIILDGAYQFAVSIGVYVRGKDSPGEEV